MEEREVVPRPGAEFDHGRHRDDPAEVPDRLQFAPRRAVVLGDGHPDRVESAEHDDPPLARRVDDAVQRRHLERGFPRARGRQAGAPGEAAVGAALVDDGAAAVALGVDDQHRAVVLEQHSGRVAEVLAGLAVDDDLAVAVGAEVDHRNRVAGRQLRAEFRRGRDAGVALLRGRLLGGRGGREERERGEETQGVSHGRRRPHVTCLRRPGARSFPRWGSRPARESSPCRWRPTRRRGGRW